MTKGPSYVEIRNKLDELAAERRQVENAPLLKVELLDRLDALIAHYAAGASSSLGGIINEHRYDFMFADGGGVNAEALRSALCAFAPNAVRDHFERKIDSFLEGKEPTSSSDRKARLAEIDQQRRDLEIEEEQAISAAESGASPIARRHDVDPDIFWTVHGPDGTRSKLRDFRYCAKQLTAAMDVIRDEMDAARLEMQRTAVALDNCRNGTRRAREPIPFRDLPAGQGERSPMLITVDPKREERLMRAAIDARAAFESLQREYKAAGERNGDFGTGYHRLREALASRVQLAA